MAEKEAAKTGDDAAKSGNMALWNSVQTTDPKHTKAITGKSYSGTSPKPYYLVRCATDKFGPIGIGWGFDIVEERIEDGAGGERLSIARVRVWYMWEGKRGEVEHIGGTTFSGTRSSGKFYSDEDAPKKSVTDALVKALSMIGFAGDIFIGLYDDSKYVNDLKNEAAKPPQPSAQDEETKKRHLIAIAQSQDPVQLRKAWDQMVAEKDRIPLVIQNELKVAAGKRKLELSPPENSNGNSANQQDGQ